MAKNRQHDAHVRNHLLALAMAKRIREQVEKAAGRGLNAARVFLASRVKETLSEPAPRKRVKDELGNIHYVATRKAVTGMPPRKLSGKLRQSVSSRMLSQKVAVVGTNARAAPTKSGARWNYPKGHELKLPGHPSTGKHPFIRPTAERYKKELGRIIGQSVRLGFKK